MTACIPSMKIIPRELQRGTISENKITGNLKIRYSWNLSTSKNQLYIWYMYTIKQVLLTAFKFEKSVELQFTEFYFGEMICGHY